jgi:DNA-binding NarL/FixJ family response regulator
METPMTKSNSHVAETEGMVKIRVLLADDHPVTRAGIRAILEKAMDIKIIGEAENGIEAQRLVAELRPQILLLDLIMPGPPPSEIAAWVRTRYPETITLVLTAHDRNYYLADMVDAGVEGFLAKEIPPHGLVQAIRRAARGDSLLTREQLDRVCRWRKRKPKAMGVAAQAVVQAVVQKKNVYKAIVAELTKRELEVLRLVVKGLTNREIAYTLEIKERTVAFHVSNILKKLGVNSRTEAAVWAKDQGVDA